MEDGQVGETTANAVRHVGKERKLNKETVPIQVQTMVEASAQGRLLPPQTAS